LIFINKFIIHHGHIKNKRREKIILKCVVIAASEIIFYYPEKFF